MLSKGQTYGSLPNYIQQGDVICLNCYNRIVSGSATFQQHDNYRYSLRTRTQQNVSDLEFQRISYIHEKRGTRLIKDTVLVDLFESNLHTIEVYIKAIDIAASVPTINKYIEDSNVIPVIADWPNQIHLRMATSRYLTHSSFSGITNKGLSFFPMIEKPFPKTKTVAHHLLLELSCSAWQEIAKMVKIKFGYNKEKYNMAEQIIKEARYINYLRFNDGLRKEASIFNSTKGCYGMPIKKKKEKMNTNIDSLPIPAMKIKEAWLCYLPLGYNASYKSSLSGCDSFNCITNQIVSKEQPKWVQVFAILDYIKDGIDKHVKSILESLRKLNLNKNVKSEKRILLLKIMNDLPKENDNTRKSANNISIPWDDTI
ncbi:hypothetical protein C2G38_2201365 [Gigaspora rosea]|uniref:Uncharacterized protein n=1 Tax=Gigaspora rosea TaxID=44941 RepID=A0A397UQU5_9GLOM|nr:hypothetical protein C2G38_2201365 [Gigaspora rosea]